MKGIFEPYCKVASSNTSSLETHAGFFRLLMNRLWNKRTPWNNSSPPLKKFHITILKLFYINLGIAVIFNFFFLFKIFQKLISVPLCLFRSLEYIAMYYFYVSKIFYASDVSTYVIG